MRVAEDTIWYDRELAHLYVECLKECIENQPQFGKDDALEATDAQYFFMRYLRQCMVEENQAGIRTTMREWAKIINDVIEHNLFGEQITKSVYLKEEPGVSEKSDVSIHGKFTYTTSKVIRRAKGLSNSKQMSLFSSASIPDSTKAIKEAIRSLGSMPRCVKFDKSSYVIRVLWVLEIAARAGLGALRASTITTVICDYGKETVAAPNVAKFFRNQKKASEYTHFWKEEPENYYSISSIGKTTLLSIMKNSKRRKA
ncbi:MAG: hypothetical protein GY801_33870 [bacterium]|nr:hypothetical protein [bacterium]